MNKNIEFGTEFGEVQLKLKEVMDLQKITISQLSQLSNLKYDIVKKYYNGLNYGITKEILAKFCYILNCGIQDILVYNIKKNN